MFNVGYVVVAKAKPIPDWAWVLVGAVAIMMLVNRSNAAKSAAQQAAWAGVDDEFGPSVKL